MATLGNSTDHSTSLGEAAGRKASSKATLAVASTLSELHAWVTPPAGTEHYVIHIYSDTAGEPDVRLAYTASLAASGGVAVEISQSGFAVTLPAGDYWLGFTTENGTGTFGAGNQQSARRLISTGSAFPVPSDPWGTPTSSSAASNTVAAWGVVTEITAFVAQAILII